MSERLNCAEDWPVARLSDLGVIEGGGTPSRTVANFWQGDIPWVTPGEMSRLREKYLRSTAERITPAGLAGSGAKLLATESLLVTTRATIGAVALAAMPVATNQGFKSIQFAQSRACPSFYYHLFPLLVGEIERRASGTTFLEISAREFASIEVPLPPLPEQQRIAEILDTLDEAIRKTEQVIAKLQQVKQGLLHDLLTRGIDEHGELRDPDRHPEQFKDSELGRVPRDWEVRTLNDVVDPTRPVVYGILMPGRGYPGGVPVVKVKDIRNERIHLDDLLLTSPKLDLEYQRSRVRPSDLLFTIRGTVGRMAVVPPELAHANITQDTARLSIVGADTAFVRQYIRMPRVQAYIDIHTIGQAVKGINLRELRLVPLAIPEISEQLRIAEQSTAMDARLRAEVMRAAKLRTLKSALMHDLLTGRVRTVPHDQ